MKLLIVEDDPVSLKMLKGALEKTGFDILAAEDGQAAWKMFQREGPRIVLSDWILPEISGLELCEKIRKHSIDTYTYFILLTSKDKKEDILKAFSAGIDDFVPKPYDIREVQARINTGRRIIHLEDAYRSLQSQLVSSRNKVRTVFDALDEEIITVDNDKRIVSMNKSAIKRTKYDFGEYVGGFCCKLAEDGDTEFFGSYADPMIESGFETGEQQIHMNRYKGKNGDEVIKEWRSIPIKDKDGGVNQVALVSRDITETYQHAEEINKLNRKLKKVSGELIRKNQKLESTLENLEKTQAQMIQSEKMASIGQLAAGVAHEINNPTGFVSSNLKTLSDYQADIQQLIGDYQELKAALKSGSGIILPPAVMKIMGRVEATEADVDIEYIKKDMSELISDCREGTERIKKIVNNLKQFAHPGEGKMKDTDINDGLESTLNVVYNELKYKAVIVKEYGVLPIISAFPQQLNQVFMNILVNAAQSIDKTGEIKISTAHIDSKVEIRISDTGCGIPEENLNRIFDPFFTTKEVGSGTGLGMNIAYNIVKKHNGDIRVESMVDKGTTFIITIPVEVISDESGSELIAGGSGGVAIQPHLIARR
jgi:two-component system NtrC family sensor kinase